MKIFKEEERRRFESSLRNPSYSRRQSIMSFRFAVKFRKPQALTQQTNRNLIPRQIFPIPIEYFNKQHHLNGLHPNQEKTVKAMSNQRI